MACGQSFLEVAANPYVTVLGPPASSERRLNLAQSFNSVGALITPVLGAAFILTNTRYTADQMSSMTAAQLQVFRAEEASTVKVPYMIIAAIFVAVGILIYLTHLPEVREPGASEESESDRPRLRDALKFGHLVKGVAAQFAYVGAQVGVASFIIRFAEFLAPGTTDKVAADYLKFHLLGFMIGRFTGSFMMKYVAPPRLLSIFAGGGLVCTVVALIASGSVPVWALVLIGFFHSIMFPTIFALSIKQLGVYTKLGSSLLVMAIIGGALFPAFMGYVSDLSDIRHAFIVPLFCYAYVFYFAVIGYKPRVVVA
jgi:MFS transporter, FHS family, L-fucose permease